ncbi:MAG: HD domain-containing protein [Lachnospiraceae bacterium]|nr:HD domain-containing protein [Lachnospiraceae bacterium]
MQFVETKDLRPGMRLAKPVYNRMGVLLYDRNSFLTAPGIKSIENFGLIGLFILEPAEPLPPLSEEDIQFEQFQTIYMFRAKEIMDDLQNNKNPETLPELVNNILERYGSLEHKINFTQVLRSSADYVYKHSISTAILCALLSNALHYTETEKKRLVTAALLYDIGYLYVPRKILDQKDNHFTDDDQRTIHECRKKGYQLLYPETNNYQLDPQVLTTIFQVHTLMSINDEEILKEKTFSSSAQLLALADMFDQLTAMNLHHAPISEVVAIRYFWEHPEKYPTKLVAALARCIHILPTGCSIDLSNKDKGIVIMENPDDFLSPLVLNIRTNEVYDLSDPEIAEDIQITDIMKTMDNRIVIDEETLQHFSADDNLQNSLSHYQERKKEKMKKFFS